MNPPPLALTDNCYEFADDADVRGNFRIENNWIKVWIERLKFDCGVLPAVFIGGLRRVISLDSVATAVNGIDVRVELH